MAGLALKALAMADRAIQKTYNSITGSTWGKAAVNDIKNVTSYIGGEANGAYNSAKNVADKSELVNLASKGAQDVGNKIASYDTYQKMKLKGDNLWNSLGGSENMFASWDNVKRSQMVLQREFMRLGNSAKTSRLTANGIIDGAAAAGEKDLGLSLMGRFDWRYRRLNGKLNTHRLVTDAVAGTAAAGAVGAAGYGAVSYFGDE